MRYLSKIFLINSAQVKYAEINVDGNVHFIGTQGVGKSTILRAILFFYNADTKKLGIPKGKRSFSEYYFPYSNSYIIYEVARSEGAYCVLAYKSRNKVCYRFIDGEFNRHYFINSESKAQENWGKIAQQLDANRIYYTKRKIDSYQDYRDILYGNNTGKAKELRRYALIESKDYQNIPRTIQNVFLNSELKAEFIKDTIIKSLGNDIQIDLSNYTHHLKGFETQLNEIRRFRDNKTLAQANTISKLHVAIKYLQSEKQQLAKALVWAVNENIEREPELSKGLESEKEKESRFKIRLKRANELFNSKEKKIIGAISIIDEKLKNAKAKGAEYEEMDIETIISRVNKKITLEKESRDFTVEKALLTTQFQEITQKYEALFKELENQLNDLQNIKNKEKLDIQLAFQEFKSEIADDFERQVAKIQTDHKAEVELARHALDDKKESINKLKIVREKVRQRRYFELEIETQQKEIKQFEEALEKSTTTIERSIGQLGTLQKQWEIDKQILKQTSEWDIKKVEEQIDSLKGQIEEINSYIEASKSALYGWLSENYSGWENTVGKVIDEKNVLFNAELSTKLIDKKSTSLFGIELDLNEIDKKVKTVSDYENEKERFYKKIKTANHSIRRLSENSSSKIDKLKKKYGPKIRECKDSIKENEYLLEKNASKKDVATVGLNELTTKAHSEKTNAIGAIVKNIAKTTEDEIAAKLNVFKVEDEIATYVNAKKKERVIKITNQQQVIDNSLARLKKELLLKMSVGQKRKEEIQGQQWQEYSHKGVDTDRLAIIEKNLRKIKEELGFIENNRDTVADYKKDKRELFDKVPDFKGEKKRLDRQLSLEMKKHNSQKQGINDEIESVQSLIQSFSNFLKEIEDDKSKYEEFSQSTCYSTIRVHFQ